MNQQEMKNLLTQTLDEFTIGILKMFVFSGLATIATIYILKLF
jgi:hypothetical protein